MFATLRHINMTKNTQNMASLSSLSIKGRVQKETTSSFLTYNLLGSMTSKNVMLSYVTHTTSEI